MASPLRLLFSDGILSPPSDTPSVTTLLASRPGAYTTTRTHNNGSVILFWERHLSRLANSARILVNSNPKLLFKSGKSPGPVSMNSSQIWKWDDSVVQSLVNDSLRKALPICLKEKGKVGEELAITAFLSGNLSGREGLDQENILKCFTVYIHVSLYVPLGFGVRENGAHLAVVGRGRDVANAKYSDWVRLRKPLEKWRPPSATELLLSNDGDQILEGCLTNFFVLCRKQVQVRVDDASECMEKDLHGYRNFELQTAPITDGVLPGVVRQVIIEVCMTNGILLREVAPSWSKRELWEEAFITNSLRLLQHVETIQVPSSWDIHESKTLKDVIWEEKRFEEAPGRITALIQEAVMERAVLEGYPVSSFCGIIENRMSCCVNTNILFTMWVRHKLHVGVRHISLLGATQIACGGDTYRISQ